MTTVEPADEKARAKALQRKGDWQGAKRIWARLLADNPDDPGPLYHLGVIEHQAGRFERAMPLFREAVRRGVGGHDVALRLAHCYVSTGRAGAAVPLYRQMLERRVTPSVVSAYLFAVLLDPNIGESEKAEEHRRWGAALQREDAPPAPAARPRDPLRVGLVSGNLGGLHPVAQLLEPALRRIAGNGARFVVYAHRPLAGKARDQVERYAEVKTLFRVGAKDAAAMIAADDLDLLVDLAGHTSGNRLDVFAHRPAPRQATYLGYTFTTGAPFIDAAIADPVVCPEADAALYSERVIRIPQGFLCFEPPDGMPEAKEKPERAAPVFGSLNNAAKMSEPTVALWARVLDAVPEARLFLKSKAFGEPETRKRMAARFARHGVNTRRIDFEPSSPVFRAIGRYSEIDLALDPLFYTGCTTTAQALRMGTPVVTLPGRLYCGRMSASLLQAAGRPEWIAQDEDAFVRIAAGLAADPARLRAEQARLRADVPRSPLCNADSWAAGFLAALREAAATPAR